jgi:hypothetical protein
MKKNDGQQFHQNQQNEQSTLDFHLKSFNIKKTKTHDI